MKCHRTVNVKQTTVEKKMVEKLDRQKQKISISS